MQDQATSYRGRGSRGTEAVLHCSACLLGSTNAALLSANGNIASRCQAYPTSKRLTQPSKLHTITYNILSSIPVSCSLNNKCMNESKLCMCLAVLQRCTTPPSIALNLFLSSCLHCVVCTSWGHGAECIKMSALWHLSFAHSLK